MNKLRIITIFLGLFIFSHCSPVKIPSTGLVIDLDHEKSYLDGKPITDEQLGQYFEKHHSKPNSPVMVIIDNKVIPSTIKECEDSAKFMVQLFLGKFRPVKE